MKKIIFTLFTVLLVSLSAPNKAISMPAIQQYAPPGAMTPMMSQSEMRLCQIKRFFCGRTGLVIVSFAILLLGVLIVQQKIHWAPAIFIIVGIIIFYNARGVARVVGKPAFLMVLIDNPLCDCRCSINIEQIFTEPAAVEGLIQGCIQALGDSF